MKQYLLYFKRTLFPFSIRARSHTATSPANLLNSLTCVSRSVDHRLTISSIVLPLSIDGGGTDIFAAVVVAESAPALEPAIHIRVERSDDSL